MSTLATLIIINMNWCVFGAKLYDTCQFWSGQRGSNPRLQPWQGCHVQLKPKKLRNFLLINCKIDSKLSERCRRNK